MNESELVLGLHEEGSLVPNVAEEWGDVDLPLGPELLQHRVYHDVGSSPAHPSAAVNEQWSVGLLNRIMFYDMMSH